MSLSSINAKQLNHSELKAASRAHPIILKLTASEMFASRLVLLFQKVSHAKLCAMSVRRAKFSEQAREDASQEKINVTSKSPVGDIVVFTLIRTDTTLDHSQKAEKVWIVLLTNCACAHCCAQVACLRFAFGGVAFARLRALLRQLYVRNVALHC